MFSDPITVGGLGINYEWVLMPWRAFSVFGPRALARAMQTAAAVLMPWRAFSVFGLGAPDLDYDEYYRS